MSTAKEILQLFGNASTTHTAQATATSRPINAPSGLEVLTDPTSAVFVELHDDHDPSSGRAHVPIWKEEMEMPGLVVLGPGLSVDGLNSAAAHLSYCSSPFSSTCNLFSDTGQVLYHSSNITYSPFTHLFPK